MSANALLPLLLLAQPVASEDLRAAAAASPRPSLCRPGEAGNIPRWEVARRPKLLGYCHRLARGYSLLGVAPRRAVELADEASRVFQDLAAPLVLKGEALAVLRRFDEAWKVFESARRLKQFQLRAPLGMHALARSASAAGQTRAARAAYRDLVPRVGLISNPRWREGVYVEAAFAVMGEGETALDEAFAYLTEAQRLSDSMGYSLLINAGLILVLERQGRGEQARRAQLALEETASEDVVPIMAERLVVDSAEKHAALAVLSELSDSIEATEHWRAYLQVARSRKSPWVKHAEQRIARLRGR